MGNQRLGQAGSHPAADHGNACEAWARRHRAACRRCDRICPYLGWAVPSDLHPGDTVWYDGVAEVARRFAAGVVLLFAGAAQTRGPFDLTMNTNDAIETAYAFLDAVIVPVHYEGWAHFTQSGDDLERAFSALGIGSRLRLLEAGAATAIEL